MKSVQIEESKEMQSIDLNYENSPPPAMRHLNSSKKDMILKKPKKSLKKYDYLNKPVIFHGVMLMKLSVSIENTAK